MWNLKTILFVVLSVVTVWFVVAWAWLARPTRGQVSRLDARHTGFHAVVAFICTFFDALSNIPGEFQMNVVGLPEFADDRV